MNDQREMEAAMRTIPHTFTGILAGTPDRPCTTCGLPDRALIHTIVHQRDQLRRTVEQLRLLYSLAIDYEREHGSSAQAERMVEALAAVPEP